MGTLTRIFIYDARTIDRIFSNLAGSMYNLLTVYQNSNMINLSGSIIKKRKIPTLGLL